MNTESTSPRPTVAVTIGRINYPRMFSDRALSDLAEFADVVHAGENPAGKDELSGLLAGADACITSWGVHQLDADVLAGAPDLKAMAHMGSSIKKYVSEEFWNREIRLTSAGITLARDVAEATLGYMIVGRQRVFPLSQHLRNGGWRDSPTWDKWGSRELTRSTVGLVGASNVGRHVISFLAPFETEILVSDPFLDAGEAAQLGVTKVELDELLRRSDTVSLHCPSNEATQHILNAEAFALMKDDALLINTARGELIDEEALIIELSKGRFFAFLDVSDPEPSDPNSPLRTLDNVVLTPHTAGCIENCNRMGELAVDELRRFFAGEAAVYQITPDMYARIS